MDARKPIEHDLLRPAGWEVGGLGVLLLFYTVMNSVFEEVGYGIANFAGAIWFGGVLVLGAFRAVRIDPVAMWTGVFWFRLASAVYFGFGSAFKIFFNEYTTQLVDSYYYASPHDLFKVNIICAVAVFLFLSCLFIIGIFFPFRTPAEVIRPNDAVLWFCGICFTVIGYSVKYLVVIPEAFGLYGEGRSSGMFATMAYMAVAGLFLLTLWCSKYAVRYMFVPTILLCADIVTGALQLSKGEVIFPLIVYILGLCRYHASFKRLAVAAATVIVMFHTLVPAVQFGRAELERRYDSIDAGSLRERMEILSQYMSDGANADLNANDLNSLSRFYYANATAAAVNQYDSGQPGNSLTDAYTIFIPRAIWKDKPIFDVGARFNLSVVGDSNSSTWMGVFVESYWNLGWIGIPFVMIPLAIAFNILGRMAITIQKESKWFHFPVALLNVWMGMRVDADIVETQVVLFFVCVIFYFVVNFIEPPLRSLLSTRTDLGLPAPGHAAGGSRSSADPMLQWQPPL